MIESIGHKIVKARKDYQCAACWVIRQGISFDELMQNVTEAEREALIKAKENGYKIKKGEMYFRWANIDCGQIYSGRAIPAVADICSKYEMWEED